eukprot:CAMPEP_0170285206 /NCGR_PEP_ID=MMETSP0116_2-20130129/42649_1 /TAXON_ID=400756 /ORGANISM="Durinskia baltica, Strain CSIRO CS-38" /LENGTH=36 /DNA_ID= /DNA_START= /DNA_END= /DNA_ORIENTATION=
MRPRTSDECSMLTSVLAGGLRVCNACTRHPHLHSAR